MWGGRGRMGKRVGGFQVGLFIAEHVSENLAICYQRFDICTEIAETSE